MSLNLIVELIKKVGGRISFRYLIIRGDPSKATATTTEKKKSPSFRLNGFFFASAGQRRLRRLNIDYFSSPLRLSVLISIQSRFLS